MLKTACVLVLVGLAALSGCATTNATRFEAKAFVGQDRAYSITYLGGANRRLLPRDWTLSNFDQDANGRPTVMRTAGTFESKTDWIWGNGRTSRVKFVTHELKLVHAASDATIWLRVLPVPASVGGRSMRYLAETWANSLNGTAFEYTFASSVDARRLATKLLQSRATSVSGHSAHEVVFDLVNLDQLQLDTNAPRIRVRALFVVAPLQKELRTVASLSESAPAGDAGGGKTPAVLFLGYSASATDFDSQASVFDDFAKRITISKAPQSSPSR